jgi:hypothetical protein
MVLSRLRRRRVPLHPLVTAAMAEQGGHAAVDQMFELDRDEQKQVVLSLAAAVRDTDGAMRRWDLQDVLARMLRRKLPWTDEELVQLLDTGRSVRLPQPIVGTLERLDRPIVPPLEGRVRSLRSQFRKRDPEEAKLIARLDLLLGGAAAAAKASDPWERAMSAVADPKVIALARSATTPRPTKKLTRAIDALRDEIGTDALREQSVAMIRAGLGVRGEDANIPPSSGDILRGAAFIAGAAGGDEAARALGDLAIGGYRKIPDHGPLSAKAAHAAMHALAHMDDGAAQLARARSTLRQPAAAEKVEHALQRAADRRGVSREELEELVVPAFGLGADGVARHPVGDHTAELHLLPGATTELRFVNPAGRSLKTVPKALKEDHPEAVGELKARAKDLRQMAVAERRRLERLHLEDRTWDYATWKARYLEHGLTGHFARRLIWWFGTEAALGAPDPEPPPDTPVRLWHPAGAETDEVRGWRVRLEEEGIQQPFKQAHREVYLLTPAELETETYSNRFAAHVLQQHQMAALCRERGWRYTLQGAWDSANEPTLDLHRWNLRAAFWVEAPWDDEGDVNEMGIFMHVLTDQVRFTGLDGDAAVPLADVPRLVLSEVMRDVDLFVGVASVGNDPTWQDRRNAREEQLDYWHAYAFGQMGEQALVRKDVLERLLPKLEIAKVADIDGRFLRVRGTRRTYKIHLGSGNILMEPNDQYLCIVPDQVRGGDRVWLPFEGDRTLAVILSKAFLLADDASITDKTILQQLR